MGEVNTNRSKKKEVCSGFGEPQLTGKKRKNEGTLTNKDVNDKRSKKDAKMASSQGLKWDKEDEIRLLRGIIDFKAMTGKNPFDDEKQMMVHEGGKWFENAFIIGKIVSFGVDEDSLKRKWGLVPKEKKNMIDQKWRILQTKEIEFVLQKAKFLNDVVSMIVEAS